MGHIAARESEKCICEGASHRLCYNVEELLTTERRRKHSILWENPVISGT